MSTQPAPTFPLVRNMEQFEGMTLESVASEIIRSYPFGTDDIVTSKAIEYFLSDPVWKNVTEDEKQFLFFLSDKNDEVSDTIIRETLLKLAYDN
jgi:hypothetical protein